MHELVFEEREVEDVTILRIERRLKGEGEYALRDRLDELVARDRLHILIDLKDVPYIDSTELGRLIRAHISLRQAGGRVRLCNLSDRVKRLMQLTRLDTVLSIYEDETEALADMLPPQLQSEAAAEAEEKGALDS